jgi:hypothetical protein
MGSRPALTSAGRVVYCRGKTPQGDTCCPPPVPPRYRWTGDQHPEVIRV